MKHYSPRAHFISIYQHSIFHHWQNPYWNRYFLAMSLPENQGVAYIMCFSIGKHIKDGTKWQYLTDNIFNCIFINENVFIVIEISMTFIPKCPIGNKSTWEQVMAWHQTGDLGPISKCNNMSYCKISSSLEAVRLVLWIIASLWNLTGALAALLPRCLSNFRVIEQFQIQILQFWDFTRSYNKTSYRILKQGTGQMSTQIYDNIWHNQVTMNCNTSLTQRKKIVQKYFFQQRRNELWGLCAFYVV